MLVIVHNPIEILYSLLVRITRFPCHLQKGALRNVGLVGDLSTQLLGLFSIVGHKDAYIVILILVMLNRRLILRQHPV